MVDGIEAAGMLLERHADALLAIDPDRIATDAAFVDGAAHVVQAAGVLLCAIAAGKVGDIDSATATVNDLLAAHPGWAKRYQDGGAGALARAAPEHPEAFGVIAVAGDALTLRPAGRRYRITVDDRRSAVDPASDSKDGDMVRDRPPAHNRAHAPTGNPLVTCT